MTGLLNVVDVLHRSGVVVINVLIRRLVLRGQTVVSQCIVLRSMHEVVMSVEDEFHLSEQLVSVDLDLRLMKMFLFLSLALSEWYDDLVKM